MFHFEKAEACLERGLRSVMPGSNDERAFKKEFRGLKLLMKVPFKAK